MSGENGPGISGETQHCPAATPSLPKLELTLRYLVVCKRTPILTLLIYPGLIISPNYPMAWARIGNNSAGRGFTFTKEEYTKIYEANLAELAEGKLGIFLDHSSCFPAGMPTMMSAGTFEYIITPETTYISAGDSLRHIFTDGRPWPTELEPTYQGFSIGNWIDEDGDGVYDVLEVETRGPFKGPRAYDASGLPLAFDNESTFKERIFIDKKNPNILHDVITVFDHALTRPWTVNKTYRHGTEKYPNWSRVSCIEGNGWVTIGKEYYLLSYDGYLMPTRKGQRPPDTRYFPKTQN